MEKIRFHRKIGRSKPSFEGDNLSDQIDSSIQEIPSIRKNLKQYEDFKAIMKVPKICSYLKQHDIDVNLIEDQYRSIKELANAIDRFDDLFSGIGWIAYWNMDTNVIKEAVAKGDSGDVGGAQADLVSHYNPERVIFELKRMGQIKAFQARMPLARKALVDYKEERYHACVPVVLALLDGMVNEAYQKALKRRCGFFAENADLIAWDSIAAHSKGLNQLAKTFRSGRYTTTTDNIDVPYRNGILHGMDLGYDCVVLNVWTLYTSDEFLYSLLII